MTLKEDLINAKKLIENRDNWFGGDQPVEPTGHRRCALMAVSAATDRPLGTGTQSQRYSEAVKTLANSLDKMGHEGTDRRKVLVYNDSHTHEEVMALFDKAIENA